MGTKDTAQYRPYANSAKAFYTLSSHTSVGWLRHKTAFAIFIHPVKQLLLLTIGSVEFSA
jgi:hypothetical protein